MRDAERLREAIGNTLERANIPDMSDEERTRTLTFVVVGAGPPGVELTAELKDFIEEDCPRFYPHLLPYIRIKVYLFLRLFFFVRMHDSTPFSFFTIGLRCLRLRSTKAVLRRYDGSTEALLRLY